MAFQSIYLLAVAQDLSNTFINNAYLTGWQSRLREGHAQWRIIPKKRLAKFVTHPSNFQAKKVGA